MIMGGELIRRLDVYLDSNLIVDPKATADITFYAKLKYNAITYKGILWLNGVGFVLYTYVSRLQV